ncbi:MAG: AAA family ATPase [Gammaproteobacteria bacterium]|nr:AAA family ATPase [Gammaproteobacteria bacterium]
MYESFYGLTEKPFTLLPDPDYLYLSPKHQRALTLLEYGMMNQAGFSVICGDTGAGKTTLIRRLLSELGDDTRVGLITNTHQSFGELLNWVLMAFGLDGDGKSKAQMHQMFIDFLIEQYSVNKHTVLIVDEAQNMTADTLEELRMLSNINADKDQVLQVILAGQPALRETLRKPELMQFAQRIAVDYYLESLSIEETKSYIHHRLSVAGSSDQIFTDAACEAVFKYSRGTPRLINLLCDTALVYGFAEQKKVINEQLVHDVVREQHSNSIIPTFNAQHASTDIKPSGEIKTKEAALASDTIQEKTQQKVSEQVVKYDNASISKQPLEETSDISVDEENSVEKEEKLVTQASMQASSVVNSADQAVPVMRTESQTLSPVSEKQKEADDSNVTPIKVKQPELSKGAPHHENEAEAEAEVTAAVSANKEENSVVDEGATEEVQIKDSNVNKSDENVAPYQSRRKNDDDVYPIVHIEDNPKKGLNMVLIGIVAGMFFASVIMMVFAWMMLGTKNNQQMMQQNVSQQSQLEAENRELKALQKERDAAIAVTKALERERDAAITAAKVQQDIRAAELRAAEILAEQEQRAEKKLQQARARIKEAERAESSARARERKLQLKAEKNEAKLEAQRLILLREERIRLEALATEKAQQKAREKAVEKEIVDPAPVVEKVKPRVVPEVKSEAKKTKSFSANPCNSPSAKFLSTCKK